MQIKKLTFLQHGDSRGRLISLEGKKNVPFDIRRIYYIYETGKTVRRGLHAHKSLEQILICVHGSCSILVDNGKEKETLLLDKPEEGLYIAGSIWREMFDFSPGTVLMVLASAYYDENDYIRDYGEFLNYIKSEVQR